jgi:hypothetical protein
VIIGITGYKSSGKSVVARWLVDNYKYTQISFAYPLKNMLKAIGLTDEQLYGDLKEIPCELLLGQTPRWAMQSLGTEWGRKLIHEDLWLNAWKHTVASHSNVVVDDFRFPNEAKMFHAMGAKTIRVIRPGMDINASVHESEKYISSLETDLILYNDASLHAFLTGLRDSLKPLLPT